MADNDLDELGLPYCDLLLSCTTEGAVADSAENPGLVADCGALLTARDTLMGSATLNWSASTPISQCTSALKIKVISEDNLATFTYKTWVIGIT